MTPAVLNTKLSKIENKIPDTSNLVTATVLNIKTNEVKIKISSHDKYITTPEFNKLKAERSQNMFVYQPTFNMLELKIDKGTEYIIGWKPKGVYKSKLIALHSAFLHKVIHYGDKRGIH